MTTVWTADSMPFLIGMNEQAGHNLYDLPNSLPFTLFWDQSLGLLRQIDDPKVKGCLEVAYSKGSLLGTAMDDSPIGMCYAQDMLHFITTSVPVEGRRILEVGAGRGYLLHLLGEAGADALGIEPGICNRSHWERHGVSVVEGIFPQALPNGTTPFDVLISYGVLEHIADPLNMLHKMADTITEGGMLCIAVPDCTDFIAAGDTSMLVHEHYSYFTKTALTRLLIMAGFDEVSVEPANYGSVLFAKGVKQKRVNKTIPLISDDEIKLAHSFGVLAEKHYATLRKCLTDIKTKGRTLGLYCPGRALNILPQNTEVRLFDDDINLQGRYYPLLPYPIEGRDALIASPVEELWIMSRSFSDKLEVILTQIPELLNTRILTLDKLLDLGTEIE